MFHRCQTSLIWLVCCWGENSESPDMTSSSYRQLYVRNACILFSHALVENNNDPPKQTSLASAGPIGKIASRVLQHHEQQLGSPAQIPPHPGKHHEHQLGSREPSPHILLNIMRMSWAFLRKYRHIQASIMSISWALTGNAPASH